jgi:1-deoxyxylulose-5-phosphate synthase
MYKNMKRRVLGRTGLSVSEIAFGGVEIGIPYGIGVAGAGEMPTERQAIELLHAAMDGGINFFDTARAYGQSETLMGRAFEGRRDQVVINTKCAHLRDADNKLFAPAEIRRMIPESLQKSLSALRTDHVDIYMTHSGDEEIIGHPDVLDGFGAVKRQGLARAIGVSTYTPAETRKALSAGVWDVIQLPLNLLDQRQAELFPLAKRHGVGIMVRSVLLKGILSDRGANLHPALQGITEHRNRLLVMAGGDERELPRAAMRFALGFEAVSSVLVGIDRMEYLRAAFECAMEPPITPELFAEFRMMCYPDPEFINLQIWNQKGWLK